MAIFIRHTGCKRCGSSDALAHYSDGGQFCFACGVASGSSPEKFVATDAFLEDEDEEKVPPPPKDLSHDFPPHVLEWLKPTGITVYELIRAGYFYSRFERGLVRLLDNRENSTIYPPISSRSCPWEIRKSFGAKKRGLLYGIQGPKTLFRGSKEQTNGDIQPEDGRREGSICLVEDSLSAIKVGREIQTFPLFGSSISNSKLSRLASNKRHVYTWLDSDKYNSAKLIAERINMLGVKTSVICSDLDPKYLDAKDFL